MSGSYGPPGRRASAHGHSLGSIPRQMRFTGLVPTVLPRAHKGRGPMSTITRLVITGLTAAAVAVTGCSSAPGSRTAASSATHTGTSTLTELVSELGRCVHDHGAPNF